MGFPQQEYWTGLPFLGDLPDLGIKHTSPALAKPTAVASGVIRVTPGLFFFFSIRHKKLPKNDIFENKIHYLCTSRYIHVPQNKEIKLPASAG